MTVGRSVISAVLVLGAAVPAAALSPSATAGPPPGTGRNLCAPPADTVAPAVTKVTFGRPTIDLNTGSRVQTVRVRASDTSGSGDPSGVSRVDLEIRGDRFFRGVRLHLASGTAAAGTWAGPFSISKYSQPGTYSIDYLSVTDAARNSQDYPGYSSVPESPNDLALHPADDPTFTVTGTPAVPPPRTPAGNLSAFTLTPSSVDTTSAPRPVRVTARFTGAAPSRVYAELVDFDKTRRGHFVFLHTTLHRQHGRWSGTVLVPRWLGTQRLQAQLSAQFGSHHRPGSRTYDAARLHRLHFASTLPVVSGVDLSKPRLTSVTFSPSSIDSTAGPEQVTVTAHATDTGSGVKSIDVNGGIRHGVNGVAAGEYPFADAGIGYLSSDSFHVRLQRTSTGAWVGTTTVRKCVPSGTYKLEVSLTDGAGNYRSYSTRQLADAKITSTVDVTSEHGDIVAPYVYSAATYGADQALFLNCSEGVANVDTSTLAVYALAPRSTRFTSTVVKDS